MQPASPMKALAVCGPTASGKSALSIALARGLGAEIVNVDSVQVYKELDIGSAKLPLAERGGIPHYLLGVFEPSAPANVARFRELALGAVREIAGRGRVPLLVGGSGMYFTVLLHGLADVPPTPEEVRVAVAALSPAEMHRELAAADPETAARLNPNDTQRVSRALEILRVTGRKPSEIHAAHTFAPVDVAALVIVICRPRDELYRRIDVRAAQMVTDGLVAETRGVLERHGEVPALRTLGYKQAVDLLQGRIAETDLVREIALHTRHFAKRQMTYWRNEPRKRGWDVRPRDDEPAEEVAGFEPFSSRAQKRMKGFRALSLAPEELIPAVKARLAQPLERTEVWLVSPR